MKKLINCIFIFFIVTAMILSGAPGAVTPAVIADEGTLLAFPGAMGFGANTTGGRGGVIRKVTTLADSGVGSFRAAVAGSAPKIIVFEVSGIIRLLSNVEVGANTTIAGQTSPEGITFYCFDPANPQMTGNGRIELNNNTIIRHIRIRGSMYEGEGLKALGQTHNVILDHVSVAWSGDEITGFTTYGSEGAQNITLQWCTFEEPLSEWHSEVGHNYGMKLTGANNGNISVYYNLTTHSKMRNPSMDFGNSGYVGDIRNNVLYNCASGFKMTHDTGNDTAPDWGSYNLINNYYKGGPDTGSERGYNCPLVIQPIKPIHFYISGHYDSTMGSDLTLAQAITNGGSSLALVNQRSSPVPVSVPVPGQSVTAADSYELVCSYAGAWPRDQTTTRVINDVRNGTGSFVSMNPSANTWKPEIYVDWHTLGDNNSFPNTAAPADTDGDGMPNAWEDAKGLNKNVADHNGTSLSTAGYTNIEVYINEKADSLLPGTPPSGSTETINLYQNDFESYASSTELQASGWTHTVSASNIVLGTTSTKFASVKSGASNSYGQVTFAPVALNAAGGASLGKNVKLMAEYRIARTYWSSGNVSWAAFTDSAKAARSETLGAGSRMDATPHATNYALFRYANYIGTGSQSNPNIYFAPSGLNTSAENNIWVRIKYVVSITDASGAYLASPAVDVYVNGGAVPVLTGLPLLNVSNRINAVRIGHSSSSASMSMGIDDIKVYITKDAQQTVNLYENDFENYASSAELQASGWTHTVSASNIVLGTTSTKFASVKSGASNSYGQVTFAPVALNAAGGASPGKNVKLTAEYRIARTYWSSGNVSWASFTDSAKAARSETLGAGSRMDATPHATNYALFRYANYIGTGSQSNPNIYFAPSGLNTSAENNIWVKIKYVVSITDASGAYLSSPTVDVYVNGGAVPVLTGLPLLNASNRINAVRIGHSSSSASMSMGIDDIKVYITKE